jgi:hypothetical protein
MASPMLLASTAERRRTDERKAHWSGQGSIDAGSRKTVLPTLRELPCKRDRSRQAGTPTSLQTSRKANASSAQLPLSRSQARNQQRSPSISG